jgi:hypothetical protein
VHAGAAAARSCAAHDVRLQREAAACDVVLAGGVQVELQHRDVDALEAPSDQVQGVGQLGGALCSGTRGALRLSGHATAPGRTGSCSGAGAGHGRAGSSVRPAPPTRHRHGHTDRCERTVVGPLDLHVPCGWQLDRGPQQRSWQAWLLGRPPQAGRGSAGSSRGAGHAASRQPDLRPGACPARKRHQRAEPSERARPGLHPSPLQPLPPTCTLCPVLMTSTLVPSLVRLPYLKRDLWPSSTGWPETAGPVMWMGDCMRPAQLHSPPLDSLACTQSSPANR